MCIEQSGGLFEAGLTGPNPYIHQRREKGLSFAGSP